MSTDTRVLVVSATPLAGPWATSELMASLFPTIDGSGLSLITAGRERPLLPQGVPVLELDGGTRSPLVLRQQWKTAEDFARQHRPDLIYFRSAGWPVSVESTALRLHKRLDRPLVTHVMDDWPPDLIDRRPVVGRAAARLLEANLKASSSRLVISSAMADAYSARYGGQFTVVHNGVDPDEWSQIPPSDLAPGYVMYAGGSASNQSDAALRDLIAAFGQVHTDRPDLRLVLSTRDPLDLGRDRPPWLELIDAAPRPIYLARLAGAEAVMMAYNFDAVSHRFLRYSMANKIGDALGSGTPLVVYGPRGIATVDAAIRGGWAEVVTDRGTAGLAVAIATSVAGGPSQDRLLANASHAAQGEFAVATNRRRFVEALRSAVQDG